MESEKMTILIPLKYRFLFSEKKKNEESFAVLQFCSSALSSKGLSIN
jgi:hypothetical protein